MLNKKDALLEFGAFRLDTAQRLLFSEEQQVPLAPKAIDTLLILVEAQGRVVQKEEIVRRVWPDTFVEEGSLARNISLLRKALSENSENQEYIQTIPKRGYRFVAPIREVPAESQPRTTEQPASDGLDDDTPAEIKAPTEPQGPSKRWPFLMLACFVLVALAVAGAILWRRNTVAARSAGLNRRIESIAVLPLVSLSRDPAQDYFVDGITDALITSLAQIRALKVISRTSVLHYKGTTKPLGEIARELDVDAILEGSVQRDGNRVRITAQLIQASSDTHLWAHSYDRDLSNILQLEGELAENVAGEIQVQVEAGTRLHLNGAPRIPSTAQDEYLLGRHIEDERDETHLKQAIQHFETAIQLSPDFAPAHASLAHAWVQRGVLGAFGFRESEAPARRAAIRALELDPQLAEAHEALADILMFYDMAWVTSEEEFRRAIELEPSSVNAHVYYATLLEVLGRNQEAVNEGKRSMSLDPLSVSVNSEYGRVLFRARRYDDAISQLRRALELDPQDPVTRGRLADAYLQTGRFPEALSLGSMSPARAARAYALQGRRAEARRILDSVAEPKKGRLDLALAYFALGDRDRGFELLGKAFDDRQYVNLIACDPRWDNVRDDPRFRAFIRRLGIPNTRSTVLH